MGHSTNWQDDVYITHQYGRLIPPNTSPQVSIPVNSPYFMEGSLTRLGNTSSSWMQVVKFANPTIKCLNNNRTRNLLLLWFTILANLPTEIKYSTSHWKGQITLLHLNNAYLVIGFSTLIPLIKGLIQTCSVQDFCLSFQRTFLCQEYYSLSYYKDNSNIWIFQIKIMKINGFP